MSSDHVISISNAGRATSILATLLVVEGNENSLVAGAKQGDHDAFTQLFQPHAKRLFQTAYRITKNHEDAEDAMQDSLLRAFVNIRRFDGRSSFSTWLTRIVINSSLMIIRKQRGIQENPFEDYDSAAEVKQVPDEAVSTLTPEKHYERRERERHVRRAISDLRPHLKQVVELRQLQENSMKQTAAIIGISLTAAKSRLFHARAALRRSQTLRSIRSR